MIPDFTYSQCWDSSSDSRSSKFYIGWSHFSTDVGYTMLIHPLVVPLIAVDRLYL